MNIPQFINQIHALRYIAFSSLVLAILSNGIWAYVHQREVQKGQDRVYVVSQGGTYEATLTSSHVPTIFEARNCVKQFCELMFSHDAQSFDQHIEAALHLIHQEDGLTMYEDFQKGGVKDAYIKYDSHATFVCEAVEINMDQEPYQGVVYGKQIIHFEDQQQALPIAASFRLQKKRRSDQNHFGLMIHDWTFIPYQTSQNKDSK